MIVQTDGRVQSTLPEGASAGRKTICNGTLVPVSRPGRLRTIDS